MKTSLIFLFFITAIHACGQGLVQYTDSANRFRIGLPSGWSYQSNAVSGPGVKLVVNAPKDTGSFVASFNVNIVQVGLPDLASAYDQMKQFISQRNGYQFIAEGDTLLEGRRYKWLLESHKNEYVPLTMKALIFLGYRSDEGVMLTLVDRMENFDKVDVVFHKIGASLRIW